MSTENPAMGIGPRMDQPESGEGPGSHIPAPPQFTRPLSPQQMPSVPRAYAQARPVKRTLDYLASPARVIAVAVVLGWLVDLLFYGKALGVSVPLFTLLLVGSMFWLAKSEGVRLALGNLWILLPLFFFAVMVAVRANFFLTLLNVVACVGLLALLAYFFSGGRLDSLGMFGYPLIMLLAYIESIARTGSLITTQNERRAAERSASVRRAGLPWASLVRGLLISLPLLIVFAALLASADSVFASYLSTITRLDLLANAPELFLRLVIIAVAAWLIAGVLAYALRPGKERDGQEDLGSAPSPRTLGPVEAATVLAAINVLFLAFVIIQFAYLFAGRTLTTLEDSDYKHYARKGFGELIAVSVLTMGMILVLRWWAGLDTARQLRLFNVLGTLMVGLSLVILTSAWLRMFYWEAVADYIATALRLYVRVFIIWLGIAYLWLVVCLWVRPGMFALGAFVAAMCYLGTLDVVNPDDNVVRFNISRASVRELYFPYLDSLSDDAVPALVDGVNSLPRDSNQRSEVLASLNRRLLTLEKEKKDNPNWGAWQSFNLSRAGSYQDLTHLSDLVK